MIEIISVPPHQAPGWVKREWVGLHLPIAQHYVAGKPGFETRGLKPGTTTDKRNRDAFEVTIQDALHAMQARSPKAARWLRTKSVLPRHNFNGNILFAKDCAEMVF